MLKKLFEKHSIGPRLLSVKNTGPIVTSVKKFFKAKGWSYKSTIVKSSFGPSRNQDKIIFRKGKSPAKIHWYVDGYYPSLTIVLVIKTPNGGWAETTWGYDFEELIAEAELVKAPTLLSKKTLPDPIKIGEQEEFTEEMLNIYSPIYPDDKSHQLRKVITTNRRWYTTVVEGVVGLDDDGMVSAERVYDPSEKPWFLVRIHDRNSSTTRIITDGEVLYSLREVRRGLKVDCQTFHTHNGTTPSDKEFLSKAITSFFALPERQE